MPPVKVLRLPLKESDPEPAFTIEPFWTMPEITKSFAERPEVVIVRAPPLRSIPPEIVGAKLMLSFTEVMLLPVSNVSAP